MLNIITYNVNGVNHPIKRKKIFSQLKRLNCSIALLQETYLDDREHQKLKREWVGQIFSASYKNGKKRGVNWGIGGINITIMNLYAPNEDNPTFF